MRELKDGEGGSEPQAAIRFWANEQTPHSVLHVEAWFGNCYHPYLDLKFTRNEASGAWECFVPLEDLVRAARQAEEGHRWPPLMQQELFRLVVLQRLQFAQQIAQGEYAEMQALLRRFDAEQARKERP